MRWRHRSQWSKRQLVEHADARILAPTCSKEEMLATTAFIVTRWFYALIGDREQDILEFSSFG